METLQQGIKVWGAQEHSGALGSQPCTTIWWVRLLQTRTASSCFTAMCQVPEGKVTAGGVQAPRSARDQPSQAAPHLIEHSGGRRGPRPGHYGVLNAPCAPRGLPRPAPAVTSEAVQLWGAERWHLTAQGQNNAHIHKAQDSPHQQQGLGPGSPQGQGLHHALNQCTKSGSAPVTEEGLARLACTRHVSSTQTHPGRAEMPLPQASAGVVSGWRGYGIVSFCIL